MIWQNLMNFQRFCKLEWSFFVCFESIEYGFYLKDATHSGFSDAFSHEIKDYFPLWPNQMTIMGLRWEKMNANKTLEVATAAATTTNAANNEAAVAAEEEKTNKNTEINWCVIKTRKFMS